MVKPNSLQPLQAAPPSPAPGTTRPPPVVSALQLPLAMASALMPTVPFRPMNQSSQQATTSLLKPATTDASPPTPSALKPVVIAVVPLTSMAATISTSSATATPPPSTGIQLVHLSIAKAPVMEPNAMEQVLIATGDRTTAIGSPARLWVQGPQASATAPKPQLPTAQQSDATQTLPSTDQQPSVLVPPPTRTADQSRASALHNRSHRSEPCPRRRRQISPRHRRS